MKTTGNYGMTLSRRWDATTAATAVTATTVVTAAAAAAAAAAGAAAAAAAGQRSSPSSSGLAGGRPRRRDGRLCAGNWVPPVPEPSAEPSRPGPEPSGERRKQKKNGKEKRRSTLNRTEYVCHSLVWHFVAFQ